MSACFKEIDFPGIKLTALCKLIDINAAWTHDSQHLNCKNQAQNQQKIVTMQCHQQRHNLFKIKRNKMLTTKKLLENGRSYVQVISGV